MLVEIDLTGKSDRDREWQQDWARDGAAARTRDPVPGDRHVGVRDRADFECERELWYGGIGK